jgi:hypothetical protein
MVLWYKLYFLQRVSLRDLLSRRVRTVFLLIIEDTENERIWFFEMTERHAFSVRTFDMPLMQGLLSIDLKKQPNNMLKISLE